MTDAQASGPAGQDTGFETEPTVPEGRQERIRLETPRHRIEGTILLARDGYRSRVSDVLNAPERDFLTLTDATLQPLDGGPIERHPFLAVARAHIVYVVAPDGAPAAAA